jgi:hypothetical protein
MIFSKLNPDLIPELITDLTPELIPELMFNILHTLSLCLFQHSLF